MVSEDAAEDVFVLPCYTVLHLENPKRVASLYPMAVRLLHYQVTSGGRSPYHQTRPEIIKLLDLPVTEIEPGALRQRANCINIDKVNLIKDIFFKYKINLQPLTNLGRYLKLKEYQILSKVQLCN